MIAPAKICEVQRLLEAGGLSRRKIAKMVGISRVVVGAIADGTRPDYEARRHARQEDYPETLGPLGRCGGCGGMVYAPCRLCRVRAIKEKEVRTARLARRRRVKRRCASFCTNCASNRCVATALAPTPGGWSAERRRRFPPAICGGWRRGGRLH